MSKHLKDFHLHQYIDRNIDRKSFNSLAKKWQTDKGVIKFFTWQMTCSLIGAFVSGLHTFRDIEKIFGAPKSTFGDSLPKRCHGFFEDLCDQVVNQIHQSISSRKVKHPLGDECWNR